MQYSQLRGLRLIIIIGLISTIVASCSSVSEPPPLDTAELPHNNQYMQSTPESDNHSKSNSASISSNQDASLPQENTDSPKDLPFDRNALQLKGITLNNVAADVIQIWGQPISEQIMDDKDPIQVLEYDGFSVGCDRNGHVIFVEVSAPTVSSGIQGVQVGEQESVAKQSLGAPDQDSGYVWRYITDTTSLRLDLDPKTNIIQSIKLLPYQNQNA